MHAEAADRAVVQVGLEVGLLRLGERIEGAAGIDQFGVQPTRFQP